MVKHIAFQFITKVFQSTNYFLEHLGGLTTERSSVAECLLYPKSMILGPYFIDEL